MKLSVYDEDNVSSDLVGSTSIMFSALCVSGGIDEWFAIEYKGKRSGEVHLKGTWSPKVVDGEE
jgi:Ca2+-dependent lipid-binding protein